MKPTYENQTTEIVNSVTSNEVFCNDGTKDITNGKKPPCINNGGVSTSISIAPPTEKVNLSPSVNLSPEEKFYQSLGLKDKGGYNPTVKAKGRFLVAVVLVAGYFAYKKYKK
jgi:hypothetical protein